MAAPWRGEPPYRPKEPAAAAAAAGRSRGPRRISACSPPPAQAHGVRQPRAGHVTGHGPTPPPASTGALAGAPAGRLRVETPRPRPPSRPLRRLPTASRPVSGPDRLEILRRYGPLSRRGSESSPSSSSPCSSSSSSPCSSPRAFLPSRPGARRRQRPTDARRPGPRGLLAMSGEGWLRPARISVARSLSRVTGRPSGVRVPDDGAREGRRETRDSCAWHDAPEQVDSAGSNLQLSMYVGLNRGEGLDRSSRPSVI
jgi:hypothetical protein